MKMLRPRDSERQCETCRLFKVDSYNRFGPRYAQIYDELTADLAYETWVDYLQDLADDYGCNISQVLDLGCGTGSFALAATRRGYDVTGVDSSLWMLKQFQAKMASFPQASRCQTAWTRFNKFSSDRPYDVAVSFFDTLNYLTEPVGLEATVHQVSKNLRAGGLFIFDLNSESAYSRNLFEYSKTMHIERGTSVKYESRGGYCDTHALYGVRLQLADSISGKMLLDEFHVQRYHSNGHVRDCLSAAGFTNVRCLQAFSMEGASSEDARLTYAAVKA